MMMSAPVTLSKEVEAVSKELTTEQQLKVISRAWGRQSGYCFFPWIDGAAQNRDERIAGYHEGPAFKWPQDQDKILEHLKAHQNDDLYWCPSLFEKKMRRADLAMDEHALWADLDTVDPRTIEDYPPSIAWESSPGRYQALWLLSAGDIQGASWPGNENQRLTYHLGADASGWDTTQLLRIPGWRNHKPEYKRRYGEPPQGKLLFTNGRRYLADDFSDLPEVATAKELDLGLVDAIAEQIDSVDRHEVWGKVRLKVSRSVRELVAAKQVAGDRSEKLWQIIGALADQGLTAVEIVAIVKSTVWNKFTNRPDELRRLLSEANKAIERYKAKKPALEQLDEGDRPTPKLLGELLKHVSPPKWLVQDLFAEGACGFIAGEPKSFKSWAGLDLALSIATGANFLDYFAINRPGPVLYVQAEDGPPTVKDRYEKIIASKRMDRVVLEERLGPDSPGVELVWEPAQEVNTHPPIVALVGEADPITISDPTWQSWLDEVLDKGYAGPGEYDGEPFRAMILDPLMMLAGEVDENRAQEMTNKVYRPLKMLARKHNVAVIVVNHMRKAYEGKNGNPARAGQRMLGSVANHAWSEDSIYVTLGKLGALTMEAESKHGLGGIYDIKNVRTKTDRNAGKWRPRVEPRNEDEPAPAKAPKKSTSSRGRKPDNNPPALVSLNALARQNPRRQAFSTQGIAEAMAAAEGAPYTQTTYVRAYQQLKKSHDRGLLERLGKQWSLAETQ